MSQSMEAAMSKLHSVSEQMNSGHLVLDENATVEQQLNATNATTDRLTWTEMIMSKMDDIVDLFKISCSVAVIFGGLIPYIPQYIKIKRSRSNDGFSTYGMMVMMDLCIRVRNMDSDYVVSSIGVRPNTMRTRRSLMGKIRDYFSSHSAYVDDHCDRLNNGTTPVYSVTSSRSSSPPGDVTSDQLEFAAPPTVCAKPQAVSELKPYHEQSICSEGLPTVTNKLEGARSTHQSDGENIISFPDDTPILNYIITENSSQNETLSNHYSQHITRPINHSCNANGQQSVDEKTAFVKSLNTLNNFWDWDDHFSYVKFLSLFTATLESLLGVPQLLSNYRKKSTRGMSVEMVVMWLSGDIFKTLYFVFRKAPVQFIACGSIQVIVDIIIIVQVIWYRRQVTYSRLPKST